MSSDKSSDAKSDEEGRRDHEEPDKPIEPTEEVSLEADDSEVVLGDLPGPDLAVIPETLEFGEPRMPDLPGKAETLEFGDPFPPFGSSDDSLEVGEPRSTSDRWDDEALEMGEPSSVDPFRPTERTQEPREASPTPPGAPPVAPRKGGSFRLPAIAATVLTAAVVPSYVVYSNQQQLVNSAKESSEKEKASARWPGRRRPRSRRRRPSIRRSGIRPGSRKSRRKSRRLEPRSRRSRRSSRRATRRSKPRYDSPKS